MRPKRRHSSFLFSLVVAFCLLILKCPSQVVCLLPVRKISFWQRPPLARYGARRYPVHHSLSSFSTFSSCSFINENIYVLSWEGCLADTVDWRIGMGLRVALKVWPHLAQESQLSFKELDASSYSSWLYNKLRALSHVLSSGGDDGYSLTCEYALMIRLLLEEQALDRGRSNGKTGKYASLFHPQATISTTTEPQTPTASDTDYQASSTAAKIESFRGRGSRPLTVGEIASNWYDGGMIRETLLTRYHHNYKNPLPILQARLDQLLLSDDEDRINSSSQNQYAIPVVREAVCQALGDSSDRATRIIVSLSHESDLKVAEQSLKVAALDYDVAEDVIRAIKLLSVPTAGDARKVCLLVQKKSSPFIETLEHILECTPTGSTVNVVESSWPALQKAVGLFGDYLPRPGSAGVARCRVPRRQLALCFASWVADPSTNPSQLTMATMNPWTHLLSLSEFTERLSARIVPKH